MTLLVISPDYASHLLPLATLATAWRDRGIPVTVATGESTEPLVRSFGCSWTPLRLGRGSNGGVMRTEQQVADEAASLAGFFEATRRGMVETLAYQAAERRTDLLWNAEESARATVRVAEAVGAEHILVDHLAYGARLGLEAAGIPYADVVLGHPSALPGAGEVYGYPAAWPSALKPDGDALDELRELCERVAEEFTAEWNGALAGIAPGRPPVADAFAAHGPLVLHNYPAALAEGTLARDPARAFLGAALREEPADAEVDAWRAAGPYVYVSFGSFLSVRDDVLVRVADAIARTGLRAAIASGASDPEPLQRPGWLVREHLPQVRLLASASAAVTHGGNNSVTEALANGVPLVVLPFSTDQFAGAAAVERMRVGAALDPQAATVDSLAETIASVLDGSAVDGALLARLARDYADAPGPARAFAAVTGTSSTATGASVDAASASSTSARIAGTSPEASR